MALEPPSRNSLPGDSESLGHAYLPLWQSCVSLQRLYSMSHKLACIWREVEAEEAECSRDTDAIVMPSIAEAERCLDAWLQRQEQLRRECAELQGTLEGSALRPEENLEIAAASHLPLRKRLRALQGVANFRSMSSARVELLTALGWPGDRPGADMPNLESEVSMLRAEVQSRRDEVVRAAKQTRETWQALGETPRECDDMLLMALQMQGAEIELSDSAIAAVRSSAAAWDAKKAEVAAEVRRIQAVLKGFGETDAFLQEHATLHSADRTACKDRLKQLQSSLRTENSPKHERLRYLYDVTGMGPTALSTFYASLDEESDTASAWRARFMQEYDRVGKYHESIHGILMQLEELHALVLEGSRFAAAKKVNEVPSLHFLEQEKFRKTLARRYPLMHDKLIGDIQRWESAAHQRLQYHGSPLTEQLIRAHEMEADPIRGILAVVEPLLQVFSPHTATSTASTLHSVQSEGVPVKRPSSAARVRAPSASRGSTPAASQCTTPSQTPARTPSRLGQRRPSVSGVREPSPARR
eukprot:TRINITY_DN26504_c0_g1_i1.p1 TRINITY_DN26504_c0_g1~~TRINITY_DN26504_c0_g1_i1.p1  ORF type:complete len:535 (+),score=103.01 TRINITY_DN26504_c0_g1_i1:22-1605(+)